MTINPEVVAQIAGSLVASLGHLASFQREGAAETIHWPIGDMAAKYAAVVACDIVEAVAAEYERRWGEK